MSPRDGARRHRPAGHAASAPSGTFERLIGFLIENYAGAFPPLDDADAGGGGADRPMPRRNANEVAGCGRPGLRPRHRPPQREDQLQGPRATARPRCFGHSTVGAREVAERAASLRRLGETQSSVPLLDDALVALGQEAMPPDLRRTPTRGQRALYLSGPRGLLVGGW